ncbi:MAG: metG [Patescibacteria group bacterium]|nr:metG [Patescibacteria group bacterium]
MNMDKKPFYITTTLPYVNAPLHMGHALEFVRADIIARAKMVSGYDVFFNTGTDEHGLKIFQQAEASGISAQEFVDKGFETFKHQLAQFGVIDQIHFVRTTDSKHEAAAQVFWKHVRDNGFIYKDTYKAKYCVGCEETKTDSELVNGECPLHPGREIEFIDEENYFFQYSAFTEKLLAFYESHPNFVVPDFRFNEIREFVKRGLQDFSISRKKEKMPWGIPVPDDDSQVMYVWFDALVNYISTLGWPDTDGNFEKYWTLGNPTQYCGKDNLRFQSAMWQAMLMAAGLPNSHQIVINGHITAEGGVRMSKTLGNGVDPTDIVSEFGIEPLRLFLAKEISSFEDSPFTRSRFLDAYNAHLANGLGNLVSRTMNMIVTYDVDISKIEFPNFADIKNPNYDSFEINKAVDAIWDEIGDLDLFIAENAPFKKVKVDEAGAHDDLRHVAQGLARIAVLLQPVMPETAKIIEQLLREKKKPEAPLFLRKE